MSRRGHRVSLDLSPVEHAALLRAVERSGQGTVARFLRVLIARESMAKRQLDHETIAEHLRGLASQVLRLEPGNAPVRSGGKG